MDAKLMKMQKKILKSVKAMEGNSKIARDLKISPRIGSIFQKVEVKQHRLYAIRTQHFYSSDESTPRVKQIKFFTV